MSSSILDSRSDENIYNIDIKIIILNSKTDKIFHKLLNLCIKYDIQLFNQTNNNCILYEIKNLLIQFEIKKKNIIDELSNKINELKLIGPSNTWLLDVDKIYTEYKKKLKDIEIIIYILKNSYDDKILMNMCCSKITNSSTSSTYKQSKKLENTNSKYIAIYSN
jgi:hypothetical protein